MPNVKLLIVTQYCWPEPFLINGIIRLLAEKGITTTVLTGKPNYPEGQVYPGYRAWGVTRERWEGAEIVRLPIFPRGKKSAWRLVCNYLSFIASGLLFGPWVLRQTAFDAVLVYAPSPILQAIPALLLARLRCKPVLTWVQDLWPESLASTGYVQNRMLLGWVSAVVRRIYRNSDRILVQSPAFIPPVAALVGTSEKIQYFPNPAFVSPPSEPSARAQLLIESFDQHFCVVFAGNLGVAQHVESIAEAAKLLRDCPTIQLVLVGSGSEDAWLAQEQRTHRLDNLVLAGRFDPTDMPAIFQSSSALLVTLRPDPTLARTVPSKLQTYLAAGRPIVAALDGEGAKLIQESGAGLCSSAGDAPALAASIRKLAQLPLSERNQMGLQGRAYFEQHFDPQQTVSKLVQHIAQVRLEQSKKSEKLPQKERP